MNHPLHRWVSPLVAATLMVGCNLGLDDATLVKTPRILAIVADHPEVAPGQDVHVRVLAFDPMHRELHYAFHACVDTATFLGGSAANGTGGMTSTAPPCVPMASSGDEGTLAGAVTQQIQTLIDGIPPSSGLDPMLLRNVLATAGLPITVNVDVTTTDDAGNEVVIVSGTKLIGITTRATPTTNPPFLYFRVTTEPSAQDPMADPVEVTYLGGTDPAHPFDCVPWLSAPASAVASQSTAVSDPHHPSEEPNHVTLSPADDPSAWEESFPIYDFSGGIRTGYEGAYYSWYSTASLHDRRSAVHSSLHTETTQGPSHGAAPSRADATLRDNTLDVPIEAGTYDVWVVVRDGHLGEAACHFTIDVTANP